MLREKLAEPRKKPAIVRVARKSRLSLTIIASAFSSFIVIRVFPPNFFADHNVNVPEACGDPEKEENEKEPWCCPEPLVQLPTDEDADCYGDYNRYADGRERSQRKQQLFFSIAFRHIGLQIYHIS
jgi:hypothetical protein